MSNSTRGDDGSGGASCHSCDDRIEESDVRRVVTRIEDERAVSLQFCGDDCFETWRSAGGFEEWRTASAPED